MRCIRKISLTIRSKSRCCAEHPRKEGFFIHIFLCKASTFLHYSTTSEQAQHARQTLLLPALLAGHGLRQKQKPYPSTGPAKCSKKMFNRKLKTFHINQYLLCNQIEQTLLSRRVANLQKTASLSQSFAKPPTSLKTFGTCSHCETTTGSTTVWRLGLLC